MNKPPKGPPDNLEPVYIKEKLTKDDVKGLFLVGVPTFILIIVSLVYNYIKY